jgi:tight adherence protein C
MPIYVYVGIFTTLFFLMALGFLFVKSPDERQAHLRMYKAVKEIGGANENADVTPRLTLRQRFGRFLIAFSQWSKGLAGARDNPKLLERLQKGGIRSKNAPDYYFAGRILAPALGVVLGSFSPWNPFMVAAMLAGAGYLGPDRYIEFRIKARRQRIRKSLPEVMDLLYVCVDAGLGMDQAMIRVSQSLNGAHQDLEDEFARMGREQRAGKPRMDAWKAMGERTELAEVNSFVSMLVQTERFGTPIAKALAMFSDDLRTQRRQAAEERAAKTTVKMIIPLVLFIFPSIFIVLLGPAILSIMASMKQVGQ